MRLIIVRHAAVDARPERHNSDWRLSPEGRSAASALALDPIWEDVRLLYTSPEPKAIGTAQRVAAPRGMRILLVPGLREVERPWTNAASYRDRAAAYIRGEPLTGWEPRQLAQERVRSTVDRLLASAADVTLVSHGLVLTLLIESLVGSPREELVELWKSIEFPDLAVIDVAARRLLRGFGD